MSWACRSNTDKLCLGLSGQMQTNHVLGLQVKYLIDLSVNYENIGILSKGKWKSMVKKQVKTYAICHLPEKFSCNRKIWHLKFETFQSAAHLALLPPDVVRVILRKLSAGNFKEQGRYA